MKIYIACIFLLFTLSACGSSESTTESIATNQTNGGVALGDPSTPPDPSLISRADSSATVLAISNGLNPQTTLISTNFYCYILDQSDVTQPFLELSVSGTSLTGSTATESFSAAIISGSGAGPITIVDSDSEETQITLEFNEYGQELTLGDGSSTLASCYQEGAAHEAALHRFMLNTPASGVFSCRTTALDGDVSIELIDGNRYLVDGQTGAYIVGSVVTDDSSDVAFVSGPLQDVEAQYFEDPNTGTQTLSFSDSDTQVFLNGGASSSSSLVAECSQQTQPKPFKLYGQASAPAVAAPEQPISGLFFMDDSFLTTETRGDGASYVEFRPNGYLRIGLPLPGGTNCTLTQPNGLPLCMQYQFDGRVLSIVMPWGEIFPGTATVDNNGTLQAVEDTRVELVTPVAPASIIGTWTSQEVDSSGVASCIVGVCSSSITNRIFHFRADGQFLFTFGEESNTSFDTGVVATFANGSSSDQSTGTYRIVGNHIELTIGSRQSVELPLHLTQSGRLAIGEFQYSGS